MDTLRRSWIWARRETVCWIDAAVDFVLPPRCAACPNFVASLSEPFCPACDVTVERLRRPRVLAVDGKRPSQTPARIYAASEYGGQLAVALKQLKYHGRPELARPLAHLMLAPFVNCAHEFDLLVPVPLHPRRRVVRGYNQSALLANEVLRWLRVSAHANRTCRLRYQATALGRRRLTPNQGELDRRQRLTNMTGVFFAKPQAVRGKRVMLVDDVTTTGATLHACQRALLRARARSVDALVLAAVIK